MWYIDHSNEGVTEIFISGLNSDMSANAALAISGEKLMLRAIVIAL